MKRESARPRVSLLVADFDNTLYDWFRIWHASFSAMLDSVVAQSGVSRQVLEREIRAIHQDRGTSEYSYLLNEIPSLKALHPRDDVANVYRDAIEKYREARRNHSQLYPGVVETLGAIKEAGAKIAIYTESLAFYAASRIRRFKLDDLVDYLYSPPDHDFPAGVSPDQLRSMAAEYYNLNRTIHKHTPPGQLKPDPKVLASIVDELGASPETTAYVGDSLMKDIAMAQAVGTHDVYAAYGVVQNRPEYELLRRVSHWSSTDVERERRTTAGGAVSPTYVLKNGFSEILEIFDFKR